MSIRLASSFFLLMSAISRLVGFLLQVLVLLLASSFVLISFIRALLLLLVDLGLAILASVSYVRSKNECVLCDG